VEAESRVFYLQKELFVLTRYSLAAAVLCLIAVCLDPLTSAQQAAGIERQLFNAANRERQNQGLPTLRWDEGLASAARKHAMEMARRSAISHQFPGEANLPTRARQSGAHYSWLAENVDQGPSATFIHHQLMNSPEHRANMLDKDMDSIGIGVFGRGGQWFAVEDISKAASQ
jgi:uncharacterized protein YkwD